MINRRLEEFLTKHNARCLNVISSSSFDLKMYSMNGHVVILQIFKPEGFCFFVPASNENDIDTEFQAVEEAIK